MKNEKDNIEKFLCRLWPEVQYAQLQAIWNIFEITLDSESGTSRKDKLNFCYFSETEEKNNIGFLESKFYHNNLLMFWEIYSLTILWMSIHWRRFYISLQISSCPKLYILFSLLSPIDLYKNWNSSCKASFDCIAISLF